MITNERIQSIQVLIDAEVRSCNDILEKLRAFIPQADPQRKAKLVERERAYEIWRARLSTCMDILKGTAFSIYTENGATTVIVPDDATLLAEAESRGAKLQGVRFGQDSGVGSARIDGQVTMDIS